MTRNCWRDWFKILKMKTFLIIFIKSFKSLTFTLENFHNWQKFHLSTNYSSAKIYFPPRSIALISRNPSEVPSPRQLVLPHSSFNMKIDEARKISETVDNYRVGRRNKKRREKIAIIFLPSAKPWWYECLRWQMRICLFCGFFLCRRWSALKRKAMEGKIVKIISPENVFLIKELHRVRLSDTWVFFDDGFSVCSARVFGS